MRRKACEQILLVITIFILSPISVQVACSPEPVNWNYEVDPIKLVVGQCVTLNAKQNFRGYNESLTKITWKKDTRKSNVEASIQINGLRLHIPYVRPIHAGYYQAIVEDKSNKLRETTDFWLFVTDCKVNEVEVPTRTGKCKASCFEVCPSGWHHVKGTVKRCYKYFGDKRTWEDAQEKCQSIGGRLAEIGGDVENRLIGKILESSDGTWIGLNDRNQESKYVWNFDKNLATSFTAWGKGQPDNIDKECNSENCVEIGTDGRWADVNCIFFRPYVCQKTPSGGMEGWSCDDSLCLKYFGVMQQWKEARTACKRAGGKLAEIFSPFESRRVAKLVQKSAWIGLNDIHEAGVYMWNSVKISGKKATYFNWAPNEPSDALHARFYNVKCPGEDCVQIRSQTNATIWSDHRCSEKRSYVCEHLRNSNLTKGAIVGIIVGALIGAAVLVGLVHELIRRRSRSAVQGMIQEAYVRNYSQMKEMRFGQRKPNMWKVLLLGHRRAQIAPAPS